MPLVISINLEIFTAKMINNWENYSKIATKKQQKINKWVKSVINLWYILKEYNNNHSPLHKKNKIKIKK